ncbi:hypothetical protein EBQ90_07815 [bacterium]|nr:hypothetical protein [bacterium]
MKMKKAFLSLVTFSSALIWLGSQVEQRPPQIPQEPKTQEFIPRGVAAFYSNTEWLNRCSLEIDGRIQGKTASVVMPWRSDTEYLTSSWAYGLNLTAVAMAKGAPRGVAVTRRHLLTTKHDGYHPWPGQTVRFLTMDNRVISRVVDQVKYLGSENNGVIDTDVAISRLNEDLPGSITPMKLIAPDALPDVAQYTCPVLRIDQENKALLVAAYTYSGTQRTMGFLQPSANSTLTRIRPYTPYYETMITGDSTSSSILIYKDAFGVTPFLLSQVTYGGPGSGPNHTALASEIQGVIEGFGDTAPQYRLRFGPYEYAGHTAPTCSISAQRIAQTGSCSITVQGSGDSTTGNPILLPNSVSSWTKNGNIWTGTATCSTQANTVFTAQLSGPGGTGRACESGEIQALVTLPGCSLSATRQGTTNTCTVSVTRTQGSVTGNPTLTPNAPTSWTKSGEVWTGNTSCSQTAGTQFSATLSGPDGTGSACTANIPAVPAPACTLVATRQGTTEVCSVSVTKTQGETSGTPTLTPTPLSSWSASGNTWSNTATCSSSSDTPFTATLSGPGGSGSCTSTVSRIAPPSCSLSARRTGTTGTCELTLTGGGFIVQGSSPVVSPPATGSWLGNNWSGTGTCSVGQNTQFTATVNGANGASATCQSGTITPVVPACSLSVVRNGTGDTCTYTITSNSPGGTITGVVHTLNGTAVYRQGYPWDNSVNPNRIFPNFVCAANSSFDFKAVVEGPGGQFTCSSARVEAVPKPVCSITASRVGTTAQCDLTVRRTSGIASGNPTVTPAAPESWTAATDTWSGRASCATASSTVFNATLSGPGGTGTACASNAVPSLNVAPTCGVKINRNGTTSVCSIDVTIFGQSSGAPLMRPLPSQAWRQTENVWSNTATCVPGTITSFNITVSGPYGKGYCGGGIK